MDPIGAILAESALFNGLSEEQLRKIQHIAQDKFFEKGDPIFWEGDEGNGFYIVAAGMVKVYKMSLEGKEQILHLYGPGHPVGEVPVFAGRHFPANAQAMEKCRLLFFGRDAFIDLITENPSLALNMLAVLSVRLRQFTVQIENLSLKEVPGRLASYLIYLGQEQHRQSQVKLPVSKGNWPVCWERFPRPSRAYSIKCPRRASSRSRAPKSPLAIRTPWMSWRAAVDWELDA